MRTIKGTVGHQHRAGRGPKRSRDLEGMPPSASAGLLAPGFSTFRPGAVPCPHREQAGPELVSPEAVAGWLGSSKAAHSFLQSAVCGLRGMLSRCPDRLAACTQTGWLPLLASLPSALSPLSPSGNGQLRILSEELRVAFLIGRYLPEGCYL